LSIVGERACAAQRATWSSSRATLRGSGRGVSTEVTVRYGGGLFQASSLMLVQYDRIEVGMMVIGSEAGRMW
jgi:hypothetical protein